MHIGKKLVALPAVALLTGLILACSSGGTAVKSGAPAATGKAQAAATKAPVGPTALAMGQPGHVTKDGKDVATVTLSDPRTVKDFEGKSALVVTVTVQALPTATEVLDYNGFNFDARAQDGTTLDTTIVHDVTELHSGQLAPGQVAKGAIVFALGSASMTGAVITYSPGLEALAYWTVA